MKILLLGTGGYMGSHFMTLYPDALTPKVDIADSSAVEKMLQELRPDIIINAAGRTGRPNIDWCEDHKEETIRSNLTGPLVLLDAARKRGIYLVHLSSGCIYQGENDGEGWGEEDTPNFTGSFYSRTKIWSEQILREFPDVLILRPRIPFDATTHERNLLMKIARFTRVLDVRNSMTCMEDFLAAAAQLIEKRASGIYNVVNPGAMSLADVADRYREIVNPAFSFERFGADEIHTVAKVPRSNCLLSTKKLASQGIVLPSIEEAVERALQKIVANSSQN